MHRRMSGSFGYGALESSTGPAAHKYANATIPGRFCHSMTRTRWRYGVHVHTQTVRYRLRQVDDLFGDQLRDPDRRFELEIALRARQMLQRKRP